MENCICCGVSFDLRPGKKNSWVCYSCDDEEMAPSNGYTYIDKEGNKCWTEDFEQSIGE